jgi:single-strand DNA-binding protein
MKAQGLARIGRDAEVRYLPKGDAVINLSLAFTYGRKGEDGKRPTQWVEGSMFGQRAETLAPFLLKGLQVVAYLEDIHIETYEGKNGTGTKLVGRVTDVELISSGQRNDGDQGAAHQGGYAQQPQRQAAPQGRQQPPPRQAAPRPASGFDDMDDDIPF